MSKGDHLYVNRIGGTYAHHGIDCGDGTVIHYTSDSWLGQRKIQRTDMSVFAKEDEVLVKDYEAFIETLRAPETLSGKANFKINELLNRFRGLDTNDLDFSPDAVIDRAQARVGEQAFNLMFHNCEHFATWCKTGIHSSEQTNAIWKRVLTTPEFMKYRADNVLLNIFEPKWPRR